MVQSTDTGSLNNREDSGHASIFLGRGNRIDFAGELGVRGNGCRSEQTMGFLKLN